MQMMSSLAIVVAMGRREPHMDDERMFWVDGYPGPDGETCGVLARDLGDLVRAVAFAVIDELTGESDIDSPALLGDLGRLRMAQARGYWIAF